MLLTCLTYLLTGENYGIITCHVCVCVYVYPSKKKTHEKNKYNPLITKYTLHVLTSFTANHVEGINHDGTDIQV